MNHAQGGLAEPIGTFWRAFRGRGSAGLATRFPRIGTGSRGATLAIGAKIFTSARAAHGTKPRGLASAEFPPVEGASG